jgi:hypothetical protein
VTSSLTAELLVDQHLAPVVHHHVVHAAVVELLAVDLAAAGEHEVLGDQPLEVLGQDPFAVALATARSGGRVESG